MSGRERRTGRRAVLLAAATAAASTVGCGPRPDAGPVAVSVVSDAPAALAAATAQGLVRFDAAGQVEPGLAGRWIVIDDGTRYIFRLGEARWADGSPVVAAQVARAVRARLAPRSGNPLLPFLAAVDEAVAMTPEVLEVRLSRPRPDLLKLFAQPEMALVRPGSAGATGGGTGPLRDRGGLLRPAPDPAALPDEDAGPTTGAPPVRLLAERTARALVRFAAGGSDAVTGGTFADWPLTRAADIPARDLRRDPAAGLFGLAVTRRQGFLADPENRRALSAAINREAVLAAVAPDWDPADRVVPEPLDAAGPPVVPEWSLLTQEQRAANLAARVRGWAAGQGAVRLAVALPAGPGANLLWGGIAASLAAAGIEAVRVAPGTPADLALVDAVAPYDSARWYLSTACRPCGEPARAALLAARDAPTLSERARLLSEADRLLDADAAFVPLARPLRWAAVGPRLTGWQPNARARHPLNRLVAEPN